jgi:hypothetical protein
VSLMSVEAVQELGLAPGALAVAVIKSTDVIIEVPQPLAPPPVPNARDLAERLDHVGKG